MFNEEYQMLVWKAGEIVPAGTYVRIDDLSYRIITLDRQGPLPATFDGHVALYSFSPAICSEVKPGEQPMITSH
jgi:hypothetical protein